MPLELVTTNNKANSHYRLGWTVVAMAALRLSIFYIQLCEHKFFCCGEGSI